MPRDRHRELIQQARAMNRAQQQARLKQKRSPVPIQTSDRDSKTGTHYATYPDQSQAANGQKLYDATATQPIVALPLSSGATALLGPKGEPSPQALPDQIIYRSQATSGPLKTNEVGYLYGQVWNYPQPEEKPGNVKYLYAVVQPDPATATDRLNLYVGGWRRQSVLVKSLPATTLIDHASVDNLGGNRFSVNLSYGGAGATIEYLHPDEMQSWTFISPSVVLPTCYGHGFWFLGEQTESETGEPPQESSSFNDLGTITTESGTVLSRGFDASTTVTQVIHSAGSALYLWKGAVIKKPFVSDRTEEVTSTTHRRLGPGPEYRTFETWTYQQIITIAHTLNQLLLPGAGYAASFTSREVTSYAAAGDGATPDPSDTVQTGSRVTGVSIGLIRINQAGVAGLGGSLTSTPRNYWIEPNNLNEQLSTGEGYGTYIDIQGKGFTTILNLDADYHGDTTDQNRRVPTHFYSSGFLALPDKKFAVFKPDQMGTNFTFYNASYHQ